jgi:hypothetical protein
MSSCGRRTAYSWTMQGHRQSVGGVNISLLVRGLTQRIKCSFEPALSLVPDRRQPPKDCCPTIAAQVGLSFT